MAKEANVNEAAEIEDVEVDKDPELAEAKAKAAEQNKTRSGVGTRLFVGRTRGQNSQVISYEQFDKSQPDTLPSDLDTVMKLTGTSDDEKALVAMIIDGFNAQSYKAASDPIAQYLNPEWDDDVVKSFRLVVRNYSVNANVSIADAVTLIKPGFDAAHMKAKSAA